jgi:hypothetical protein
MSVRSDSCRAHCLTGGWASTKVRRTDLPRSAAKRGRLDEAVQAAAYAYRCLAVRTELADVGRAGFVAPELVSGVLTRFADIFTDFAVRTVSSRRGRGSPGRRSSCATSRSGARADGALAAGNCRGLGRAPRSAGLALSRSRDRVPCGGVLV